MNNKISGEYWITDTSVQFADGQVGDTNHEMFAYQHVIGKYLDGLVNFANELGIDTEGVDEYEAVNNPSVVSQLLQSVIEHLGNRPDVHKYIMNQISAGTDAYKILQEKGDPTLYVMKYEGWIAVRSMNIELYNFNKLKKRLLGGLDEIFEQEGFDETISPEDIEFTLFDLGTQQQSYVTLADIEAPEQFVKANNKPGAIQFGMTSTGHSQFNDPTDEIENIKNKNKSTLNKWDQEAKKLKMIGPGQQLLRGTSESFKEWLKYEENRTKH